MKKYILYGVYNLFIITSVGGSVVVCDYSREGEIIKYDCGNIQNEVTPTDMNKYKLLLYFKR